MTVTITRFENDKGQTGEIKQEKNSTLYTAIVCDDSLFVTYKNEYFTSIENATKAVKQHMDKHCIKTFDYRKEV